MKRIVCITALLLLIIHSLVVVSAASYPGILTPPSAPVGLIAEGIDHDAIKLTWVDTSNNEDGFYIEVAGIDGQWVGVGDVGPNVEEFIHDKGLEPNTDYLYRVRAYNKFGGYSDEVQALGKTLHNPAWWKGSSDTTDDGFYSDDIIFSEAWAIEYNKEGHWESINPGFEASEWDFDYKDNDYSDGRGFPWCEFAAPGKLKCDGSGSDNGMDCVQSQKFTQEFHNDDPDDPPLPNRLCMQSLHPAAGDSPASVYLSPYGDMSTGYWITPSRIEGPINLEDAGYSFESFRSFWAHGTLCGQTLKTFNSENKFYCESDHIKAQKMSFSVLCESPEGPPGHEYPWSLSVAQEHIHEETCPGNLPVCDAGECVRCTEDNGGVDVENPQVRLSDVIPGSLKVDFDEEFMRDAIANRKFIPSGQITPFDDFYVEIKIKICPHVGYAAPSALAFLPSIETDGVRVVQGAGLFFKVKETSTDATYRWTLRGWNFGGANGITHNSVSVPPTGMTSAAAMELLVKSIVERKPIEVIIEETDDFGTVVQTERSPLVMGSCTQVYGDSAAPQKIVGMRGKSIFASNFAQNVITQYTLGPKTSFESVDPFRQYPEKFAYYADLKNHDDSGWSAGNPLTFSKPERESTCNQKIGLGRLYFFYHGGSTEATHQGARSVWLSSGAVSGTVIHETGHAFCNLWEEYTPQVMKLGTNCQPRSSLPGAYSYRGVMYGDMYVGCAVTQTPSGFSVHRPSANSVMRSHLDTSSFNVVSCGYCMAGMHGGTAHSHFPACNNPTWNTIKKEPV